MSIIEFIAARIDEDEAAAHASTAGPWLSVTSDTGIRSSVPYAFVVRPEGRGIIAERHTAGTYADIEHMARHDPVRVLREVAAKRKIVEEHQIGHDPCDAHDASMESVPCDTICALASVYSDHPDYDPTWA